MRVRTGAIRAVDRLVVSRTFTMGYRSGRLFVEALALLDPVPRDVEVRKGTVAGRRALLLIPGGAAPDPRVVWFHGGAYCYNSPRIVAGLAARLAKAVGASVIAPSYRLAPEHPYPAAQEDALAVVRAIQDQGGPVIVAGDSAGAGLALEAAIASRDAAEPVPAGMLLMSPWADLTLSGESIRANDGKDAILRAAALPRHATAYAGEVPLDDPRISPINANLAALPPALVQCGADELFLSECTELVRRLEAAGTQAELQVYRGMWHDFQVHAGLLEPAAAAVGRMADWARPLLG